MRERAPEIITPPHPPQFRIKGVGGAHPQYDAPTPVSRRARSPAWRHHCVTRAAHSYIAHIAADDPLLARDESTPAERYARTRKLLLSLDLRLVVDVLRAELARLLGQDEDERVSGAVLTGRRVLVEHVRLQRVPGRDPVAIG